MLINKLLIMKNTLNIGLRFVAAGVILLFSISMTGNIKVSNQTKKNFVDPSIMKRLSESDFVVKNAIYADTTASPEARAAEWS